MRSGRRAPGDKPASMRGGLEAKALAWSVTGSRSRTKGLGWVWDTGVSGALARSRAATSVHAKGLLHPSSATALMVAASGESARWQCAAVPATVSGVLHACAQTTAAIGTAMIAVSAVAAESLRIQPFTSSV